MSVMSKFGRDETLVFDGRTPDDSFVARGIEAGGVLFDRFAYDLVILVASFQKTILLQRGQCEGILDIQQGAAQTGLNPCRKAAAGDSRFGHVRESRNRFEEHASRDELVEGVFL